jgi:hypothetical protein
MAGCGSSKGMDPAAEKIALTKRGVENPKVIDLICPHKEEKQVILQMLEPRAWGCTSEQVRQLAEKFDSYVEYVLGGWLQKQYPQYADWQVGLELVCAQPPRASETEMLDEMQRYAETKGLLFSVTPDPAVSTAAESSASDR